MGQSCPLMPHEARPSGLRQVAAPQALDESQPQTSAAGAGAYGSQTREWGKPC